MCDEAAGIGPSRDSSADALLDWTAPASQDQMLARRIGQTAKKRSMSLRASHGPFRYPGVLSQDELTAISSVCGDNASHEIADHANRRDLFQKRAPSPEVAPKICETLWQSAVVLRPLRIRCAAATVSAWAPPPLRPALWGITAP